MSTATGADAGAPACILPTIAAVLAGSGDLWRDKGIASVLQIILDCPAPALERAYFTASGGEGRGMASTSAVKRKAVKRGEELFRSWEDPTVQILLGHNGNTVKTVTYRQAKRSSSATVLLYTCCFILSCLAGICRFMPLGQPFPYNMADAIIKIIKIYILS